MMINMTNAIFFMNRPSKQGLPFIICGNSFTHTFLLTVRVGSLAIAFLAAEVNRFCWRRNRGLINFLNEGQVTTNMPG